jgi:hypothetical protein
MAELQVKVKTVIDKSGLEAAKKALANMGGKGSQAATKLKQTFSGAGESIKETVGMLGPAALAGPTAAIAALAAGMGVLAVGSFKAAEEARKVTSAFVNLSGGAQVAALNLQAMQNATRGLVSETEQMQIANRLLGMNIVQTADQLEEVVGISRRLGKEFAGLGAADAAQEFAIMIANMSKERLDSFGISSGAVKKRIKELKAETAGMTEEAAFFQATMEEGQKTLERLGPEITTSAEESARLAAEWANLKVVMGEAAEGTGIVKNLTATIADQLVILRNWSEAGTDLATKQEALQIKIRRNEEAIKDANEGWFQSATIAKFWTNENEKLKEELSLVTAEIDKNTAAAKKQQEAQQAAIRSEEIAAENLAKREESEKKFAEIQEQFARDVIDIQADTQEQLADSQETFDDNSIKAAEDHAKTLANIKEKAAKAETKAAAKLKKDLSKVDTNLKKSLIKAERDEGKKIAKAQADFAKQDKSERKRKQIDALSDERLFQFELRNLAADGEGIAIKEALERRAIEQQIASEKAEFEKDVESDKRKDQIESIKQEGVDRREELKQQAAERRADLQERNEEAAAERRARLAEDILQENEAFAQKKADLQAALTERNEAIRESERERIEEIAKGLAETEEMTNAQLDRMIELAKQFGPEFGEVFADGMTKAFSENLKIDAAIEGASTGIGASAGGLPIAQPVNGDGVTQSSRPNTRITPFKTGGILGSDGIFFGHQGEEVANPNEGQAIVIDGEKIAVRQAGLLAGLIEGLLQRQGQAIIDTIAETL